MTRGELHDSIDEAAQIVPKRFGCDISPHRREDLYWNSPYGLVEIR